VTTLKPLRLPRNGIAVEVSALYFKAVLTGFLSSIEVNESGLPANCSSVSAGLPVSIRKAFVFAKVWGSRHGGSIYAQVLAEELLSAGCKVEVLSEQFIEHEQICFGPSLQKTPLAGFFSRNLRRSFTKLADNAGVWSKVMSCHDSVVIVLGDLPRLTYVLLQILVPVVLIRQDGILTCPANNRFLAGSHQVCKKPLGLSCLAVNRKEDCFGDLPLLRRIGRTLFRIRDDLLLRCIKTFVANSRYVARAHRRSEYILYPPRIQSSSVSKPVRRVLSRLVVCGHLDTLIKGAHDAIRVLAKLPAPFFLEILGEGRCRQELERAAQELGVANRVRFLGWVHPTARDAIFASAGLVLITSLCDEAFGMVGIEAFAQGTPVVAYDVGGISEWCWPEAGILVQSGDTQACAEAVLRLMDEPQEWARKSSAARKIAQQNFTREHFRQRLWLILQAFCSSNHSADAF
jgi:glycosyltransferase involved in cell wall biosynthesis